LKHYAVKMETFLSLMISQTQFFTKYCGQNGNVNQSTI